MRPIFRVDIFRIHLKIKLLFCTLMNEQVHVQLKLITNGVWKEIINKLKVLHLLEDYPLSLIFFQIVIDFFLVHIVILIQIYFVILWKSYNITGSSGSTRNTSPRKTWEDPVLISWTESHKGSNPGKIHFCLPKSS